MLQRRILLLLDSLEIRKEVLSYSVDLARRLEAALYVLFLLYSKQKGQKASDHEAKQALESLCTQEKCTQIEVYGTVRQGDPVSELLKYLAESRPFQAIIWGGNEQLLGNRSTPVKTHWLEQIRKKLECPLVVPSQKDSREGRQAGARKISRYKKTTLKDPHKEIQ